MNEQHFVNETESRYKICKHRVQNRFFSCDNYEPQNKMKLFKDSEKTWIKLKYFNWIQSLGLAPRCKEGNGDETGIDPGTYSNY